MLLIGHRVQKRSDTRGVVVKPEVRRRKNRRSLAPALIQICQNAYQIAGLLCVGRDKYLVFQELQKVRRQRPALYEIPAFSILFRRWRSEQPEILADMYA